MSFTPDELALLKAFQGSKVSDRVLRARAGLTVDQAIVASVGLAKKIGTDPRVSLREAARNLWH